MGGSKSIDVPVPKFKKDPLLAEDRQTLSDIFGGLTSGDFLDPTSDLGFLTPLTDLDPEQTRLALESAQGLLSPQFAQDQQDLQNQIIALGGGTSSTLGDQMVRQQGTQQSQFQGITAGAALDDRQRALSNIGNLFNTGITTGQSSIQSGLQAQDQRNQFEQRNFENQIALQQLNQSNSGGIAGGLTGGIGGAIAGFALAPFTGGSSLLLAGLGGLAGGAAGALGPPGTGGSILSAGSGIAGAGIGAGSLGAGSATSSLASNNPFTQPFNSSTIGGGKLSSIYAGL